MTKNETKKCAATDLKLHRPAASARGIGQKATVLLPLLNNASKQRRNHGGVVKYAQVTTTREHKAIAY